MSDTDALTAEVRLLRSEVNDALRRIEDKTVSREVYAGLERRVGELEGTTTWIGRLIIGLVLTAIVGAILAAGPVLGG